MKKVLTEVWNKIILAVRRAWVIAMRRPKALFLAGIIIGSFFGHTISVLLTEASYRLSNGSVQLIGDVNPALADKLKLDKNLGAYRFNPDAITPEMTGESDPSKVAALLASQKQQTGGGSKDSQNLYSLDLPIDPSAGVKVYDINSKTSFKLIPEFEMGAGRSENGRVVYPLDEGGQAVYTVKANGIKEDIVLQKPRGDELSFKYKLELPKTLEARLDDRGNLGIYSVDPAVSSAIAGALQNGATSTDTERLKDVQENGTKDYLTYLIPAPTIVQSGDQPQTHSAKAMYRLNGEQLTVETTGLEKLVYPIAIDPTVVVTSTSDFATGNDEGNISFDTDAISRAGRTSGSIGTWTATASFTTGRHGHTSAAYNGYLYVIGGNSSGGVLSDVQYAPLNANGTVGTWTATTSFTTGRHTHISVAYNGYLYVIGGYSSGGNLSDVQYAPLNTDGTVGTWTATTSFTTGRHGHTSVVDSGYLYVIGGWDGSGTFYSDVQYAPLNANGTVGTWTATTSLTAARTNQTSVIHKGSVYIIGGNTGTAMNDVQYARVDVLKDIKMSAWSATTSFGAGSGSPTARVTTRSNHGSAVYNGYIYLVGGTGSSTTITSVHYAPLNTNGTVGAWAQATSIPQARAGVASIAVNGYLYAIGGQDASAVFTTSSYYAPINADGTLGSWATTTVLTSARSDHGMVSYNGYMYVTGGITTGGTRIATVEYAAINANGTLGTWTATTTLAVARGAHGSAVYNGFIYVIGGSDGTTTPSVVLYAPINANGTLGSWNSTTTMAEKRSYIDARIYQGYMFITGGWDGASTEHNTIAYAKINTDGTLGSWSSGTSFTTGRDSHGAEIYNGYIYITGGWNGSTLYGDVQYANLIDAGAANSPGMASAWTATTSLPAGVYGHSSVAHNDYVYVIGGYDGSVYRNDIKYAPINANGTIGSWTTSVNNMTTGRLNGAAAVYNGYLYVSGGQTGTSTYANTVEYAKINTDGTLDPWQTSGNTFTTARSGHVLVAHNGRLYIVGGGDSASVALGDVKYATINTTNGAIGVWTDTTATTAARDTDGFMYGGRIYLTGGYDGTTYFANVRYAPINADGTLGVWTTSTNSFINGRSKHAATALNGYIYISGGGTTGFSGTSTDVQYAVINSNGSIGAWRLTNNTGGAAYAYHTLVAYKGNMYSMGGMATLGSAIADNYRTALNATALKANYSKITNIGQLVTLNSIATNGSFLADQTVIMFRVAGSSGVFGSWQSPSALVGAPQTDVQYVMYKVNLDDSLGSSVAAANGSSSVTDITIDYTVPAMLTPENRLRQNKFFDSSGLLQPLQTQ